MKKDDKTLNNKQQKVKNNKNSKKKNSDSKELVSKDQKKKKPSKKKVAPLRIIPLGGLCEIGKNMTCFEYGNDMIIVDVGMAFAEENMPGVDAVIPDFNYVLENRSKLRGIFLTHGHEDHIGSLPYFLSELKCPIYGGKLTVELVRHKLSDKGVSLAGISLLACKNGDLVKAGTNFYVEFIRVNHSIADSYALAIRTPVGMVIHSGDFKVDYTPINGKTINLQRFGELGKEVVIELTKGLEIGDYQFSKYIPEYLGVLIMHMYPEELNEVLYELKHLLEGGNEKVTSVTLQTLGVMLQNYSDYQGRFHEEDKVFLRRRDVIIGMLLSGMANYHEAVSREGFLVLGKMIFGTDQLTLETKAEIFKVLHKKMLTLIEDREGDTLRFFNNAACLNHIYRFISDYQFFFGSLPLKEVDKAAFFPGTFDPFSQGHKGIVTAIRDEGYEVYLALDEFSWSKNTQAREYRKKIMNMSCADEPGVYIFPDDQPINIANPEDIRKLKNLFDGKEVFIVVGSDVIANASSYQKKPEIDSIHSLNHIVFRRESMEQKTEGKRSYEENLEKITGKVIELTLPTHLEDISSSKIRDNIDNNRDVASLIDPIAQSYIYDNALYMRQPMYKFILSAKSLNFDSQRNENGLNRCVITDESRGDAVIAEALAHNVESARLYNEFDNLELASFVREKAAGRILVIHRINADKSAIEEDACQLIITEVLSEALKDDYTYAVFHDREFQDKSAKEQKYIIDVLLRQGFKEIIINERATGCYGVNMSCPVTLIQNMNTVLKAPFNKNSQVQKALVKAHKRLQQSLVAMFPDTLILSYDSTVMHHKLIRMITQENGVPSEEQEKRVLGPYMCVPFGKILNGMAAPNTVTKTLHMEKSFSPNLENFRIKEYPNYASIENQVRTIKSFHRPVILVDDILHKGYRMRCLDPILNDNDVKVHKILVGILSGIGRDLMNLQGREIDSAYFVPNLNAWFVESTLYPFIGGDGVERHTGTIDDDFTSINMILPYMIPSFLARRCTKEAIYDYSMVCLENARDIMKVLEEEYQKIFQKKLTLQRLSEAIHSPKLTDVGQCLDFDRALAASSYIEDDIERLQRMRGLLL